MGRDEYTHAVAVCAYVEIDGRFLLLRRRTPPLIWVPPGGKLLADEDPVAGVIREVGEETGYRVQVLGPANTWFGRVGRRRLLSIDYVVDVVGGEFRLSGEHSAHAWCAPAELRSGRPVRLETGETAFRVSDFEHAARLLKLYRTGSI